ncbi:unnamed protein product [Rotaria socialis]|uniref:Uncharacterized protein n=1 Tax=Rotaria socialis TaxID=392032 RepID=A0A820V1J9_9BILA|nr:unnamed protein product [Rotaria socialis]CAF3295098.1 unnamed protein product [Rotaria socialis]CAF3443709.1 unnamed protein product [Rotaria socialis]CAF4153860.1 unnamed protein product [Rotaria socialis]CAF4493171.1 unnamed protein product [Rotaria socialis]
MGRRNQGRFNSGRRRRQRRPNRRCNSSSRSNMMNNVNYDDDLNDSSRLNTPHQNSSPINRNFTTSVDQFLKNLNDQNNALPQEQLSQKQNRKKTQNAFLYEKELIHKKQSLLLFLPEQTQRLAVTNQFQNKEGQLNYLLDEYSHETIPQEWKPASTELSIEIYQHAFTTCEKKLINN